MRTDPNWKDLFRELKVFTIWAISGLIDSSFLALWVFVQWLVDQQVITKFQLSGTDQWVFSVFQVLFAVSTLAPVVIYIYVDLRVMLIRAQKRIKREREMSK
jgi:uncharacterized membrane protein YciS (DUF1049 family)